MSLSFADQTELRNLVNSAKLEGEATVSVSIALLEALLAVPQTDEQTMPLPLA